MLGVVRLALVFGVVAVVLLSVFRFAAWRADGELLSRYCDAPSAHLALVERLLTEPEPVGEDGNRPYIIAAKLIYLIPQKAGESNGDYLLRLRGRIRQVCR